MHARKDQFLLFDLFRAFEQRAVTDWMFYPKRPIFLHVCPTYSELPSNTSTMDAPNPELASRWGKLQIKLESVLRIRIHIVFVLELDPSLKKWSNQKKYDNRDFQHIIFSARSKNIPTGSIPRILIHFNNLTTL